MKQNQGLSMPPGIPKVDKYLGSITYVMLIV
jgi:hypothetical protein